MAALTDRHVVVTGGTGALGTAIVHRLVDDGATCWVPHFEATRPMHWPLLDHPRVHLATGLDLTNEELVEVFYGAIPVLWGSVHCAGGFEMGPFATAELHRMWTMNVESAFLCCRTAVRRMRAHGRGGRIVNVASRQALEPRLGAGAVPYTMSKAAVAAMTTALGQEVQGEGILVNAVAPAMLDTPANRRAMPNADYSTWTPLEAVATIVRFLVDPEQQVAYGAIMPIYGAGGFSTGASST